MNYGNIFYRTGDGHIAVDLWDTYIIYHLIGKEFIYDSSISFDDVNVVYVYNLFDKMRKYRRVGKNPSWDSVIKKFKDEVEFRFRKRHNNGRPQMWLSDDNRRNYDKDN